VLENTTLEHIKIAFYPSGALSEVDTGLCSSDGLSCLRYAVYLLLQSKTVQPKPGAEEVGQIVQTESPVHHSNVMHWSKQQNVRSRIRHQCVLFPFRLALPVIDR